jgi:hypothetical protein
VLGDPVSRRNYDHYALRYTHKAETPYSATQQRPSTTTSGTSLPYTGYGGRVYYRTVDQATLEKEEKARTRDWILAGAIILVIILIPLSGKLFQKMRLNWYGTDGVAEVVSIDVSLTFFFYSDGETMISESYPGLLRVDDSRVVPGGMPVAPGDRFRVRYLRSRPMVNRISLEKPSVETLDRYCSMIYLRWASSPWLDSLADGSMKAVFTYALCDSLYQEFGISGPANFYFAGTPPFVNPHSNNETFHRMAQKPAFKRIVENVRKQSRAD